MRLSPFRFSLSYPKSMRAITSCGIIWFQLSGMLSNGRRNALFSPGADAAGLLAHDRHALAQHHLPVCVVEHARDLHQTQLSVARVLDIAGDLHHRLLQIAFVRVHLRRR